jgi:leucyl aminopeptidase
MANGLETKIELKDQIDRADTAVVFINTWSEKAAPTASTYSKEIAALGSAGLLSGKAGAATLHLLPGDKTTRLIIIGLGDAGKETAETFRVAGGALAKLVKKYRLSAVAITDAANPAALVSGFILGGFEYRDYKGTGTRNDKPAVPVKLRLIGKFSKEQRQEIDRAIIIAESQNYARTIASRPGNDINPPSLAKVAQNLGKEVGLAVNILDEKQMKKLGMGGILAVGSGSNATPPRMIVLEHDGSKLKMEDRGSKIAKKSSQSSTLNPQSSIPNPSSTLLVVGKAITFDTGGISIKGAAGMQKMVFDKCGGMAVLGLMRSVALLKLPVRIVGILASAENHISETAYRPGDILKMYNGVTVEVTNTDAEGRLVLGDALAWGIETYKPAAVIDLATLTGGVVVALGNTMAGLMANNDKIVEEIQSAAKLTGEKMWRLPIGEDQRDYLKSDPADIVNSGPRVASPLQGGAFLSYFVPDSVPWAHLDIAGVADTDKELPYYAKGATGWGIRTLVEWVAGRIKQ